ncbi:MAG: methylenetetrahydrofolate--tRNA-(uracil(54)-C(5))-methyltransferase (FADH(2)-oxidizing) TrmFO [Clostridia bacterium]|nr:methylenetetrahydrofolate--tRNA-(uracil(54)-C(5))-methyltransferase (FADH(2)-oxidizing) TrmFO [Clostridia bacterium]
MRVTVIGAGLAGCECAWQLAKEGVQVDLYEMKPFQFSPAHKNSDFAELVCSNSFKNDTLEFASGVLKNELRMLDSLILSCADATKLADASSLTVDRQKFARLVTEKIKSNPKIKIINKEVTDFDVTQPTVICSGPLCSDELANFIQNLTGERLYFYDAIAPIVGADSIDYTCAFWQERFGKKGEGEYLNCPLNKQEYFEFVKALANAERVKLHDFETEVNFEGCLPVEVMAKRGGEVLRCGPMKTTGLEVSPETYAVVQLRKENKEGTMLNMVGFQTNLTYTEQRRVFSLIPALKQAEWLRFGVMHRNTYINAPKYLNRYFQLKTQPNIMFGGQISGVEGYIESVASGYMCGVNMARLLKNKPMIDFGTETCLGALANYLEAGSESNFQPMHINWGLLKPLDAPKNIKKARIAQRSMERIREIKEELSNEN